MELHESILRYDNLAMQRAEMEDIFQNIITQKVKSFIVVMPSIVFKMSTRCDQSRCQA